MKGIPRGGSAKPVLPMTSTTPPTPGPVNQATGSMSLTQQTLAAVT